MKLPKRAAALITALAALLIMFIFTACKNEATVICPGCGNEIEAGAHDAACGFDDHYRCDSLDHYSKCRLCKQNLCLENPHGKEVCLIEETTGPETDAVTQPETTSPETIPETQPETDETTVETTPVTTPETTVQQPQKSADASLKSFVAAFPNGHTVDMRTAASRNNIVVTGQTSVTVSAVATNAKAKVTGHTGVLALTAGTNNFRVTVTAENGGRVFYNFTITVNAPAATEPQTPPASDPVTPPATEPETTPETQPETTPETQPETTPETQPETTPETQPETTPETTPETHPETTPETEPPETETPPATSPGSSIFPPFPEDHF